MTRLLKALLFLTIFLFAFSTYASDKKKSKLPAANGMSIRLDDSILQQVEFRAKSFGPGFCRTEVTIDTSDVIVFAAPPTHWTDWQKSSDAFQGGVRKIAINEVCDTGSMVEVRFFSK